MRQFILLGLIVLIVIGAASAYNAINPPAPKTYKVIYFGAGDCGACKHWRREILPDWKKTDAATATQLVIKEAPLLSGLSQDSFGSYNEIWREVSARSRGVPAFALIDEETNRIAGTYFGIGGWNRLARRVDNANKRADRPDHAMVPST